MTREEYKELLMLREKEFLAELLTKKWEEKQCSGCVYHGCDIDTFNETCKKCTRINYMTDYYIKDNR